MLQTCCYQTPPDRRQWFDSSLLRRTIQRQLSLKLTFALTGTTAEAHHGLPIARCLTDGSNMRIADLKDLLMEGVAAFRRKRQQTTLTGP